MERDNHGNIIAWDAITLTEQTGCGEMKIILNLDENGRICRIEPHFGKNGSCIKTILDPFCETLKDTFALPEKNAQLERISSFIGGVCMQGEGNTCIDILLKAILKYMELNIKDTPIERRKNNGTGN